MADIQTLTVPGILIENVDRTRMTRATGSFRIEYQLGARGRADVEIRDVSSLGSAYRPGIDQTVRVNPNLFSGAVFNVADAPIVGPHVGTLTRFQAMDNWRFAARRRVSENYQSGLYLADVSGAIIQKYLGAFGIVQDPTLDRLTTPILGELVFDYSTVEDVFNRLAVLTSWVYRLTPANVVQWFPVGGKARGITFSAAQKNIIGPVQWTQTQGTFANRIILRYGTGLVDRTESFVGDGATRAFLLTAPMAEAGWIRYPFTDQSWFLQSWIADGIQQPQGNEWYQTDYPANAEYQGQWPDVAQVSGPSCSFPTGWGPSVVLSAWFWDPANHCLVHHQGYEWNPCLPGNGIKITPAGTKVEILQYYVANNKEGVGDGWKWHHDPTIGAFGAIVSDYPHPPRAGLAFTFDYKVQYPLVVIVEDPADIAVNGISEDLREEPTIFERQAATDFANGLLRKQKKTPRTAHLSTRVASDFLPGDTVQLDIPSRTLPASSWLVTSVVLSADVDQNLTTQLELLEGSEAQGSWIDFWRNMLGSGSGSGQGIASGSVIPGTGGTAPGTVLMFLPSTPNRLTKWASTGNLTDSVVVEIPGGGINVLGSVVAFDAEPKIGWNDSDAPVDQRNWFWWASNGILDLQAWTDAGAATSLLRMSRAGVATFTGIPIAPTAPPGTNNTQLATTAFVRNAVATVQPGAHAATHQPGGADPLTALSASILTTGTLPFARVVLSGPGRLLGSTNEVPGGGPMTEITLGAGLQMQGTQLLAATHHTTHQTGGTDVVDVKLLGGFPGGIASFLRSDGTFAAPPPQSPSLHKTTHQTGGTDVVDVTLLGGYPGGTAAFLRADGTFAAPPGGTIPGAHHATHEPGGSDVLVNNAWLNLAQTFTQDQTFSKAGRAQLTLTDTTQAAGSKTWAIQNNTSKFILVAAPDDGSGGGTTRFQLDRSGPGFVSGDFSVNGGSLTINGLTIPTVKISGATPLLQFTATGGGVDLKTWRIWNSTAGPGALNFDCVNDNVTAVQTTPLYLTRPGDAYFARDIYQAGRIAAVGVWTNWSPVPTTWEGAAIGGSIQCAYMRLGKTVFWRIYITGFSIPAATAYLVVPLPNEIPEGVASFDTWISSVPIYLPGAGYRTALAQASQYNRILFYPDSTVGNWPAGTGHIFGIGFYSTP